VASLKSILKEVEERRRRGDPLREQLLWRIEALSPHGGFEKAEIRDAFSEVFCAFEPPGFDLKPDLSLCVIDPDTGGIVIGGTLCAGGQELGIIQRRLMLKEAYAIHEILILKDQFRGRGISVVSLKRSFEFYDQLGMRAVILEADMTGKWHWARVGFDFILDKDLKHVRDWTERALKALNITELRVENYQSAAQFARMGGVRKLSFSQLGVALPPERLRIQRIAGENGLDSDTEVPLARVLMLCGPKWFGQLELSGPGRVAFDSYAEAKFR
jgi:hypothetical protein